MDRNEIIGIIENVLFAAGDAVETDVLSYILDVPVSEIEEAVAKYIEFIETYYGNTVE